MQRLFVVIARGLALLFAASGAVMLAALASSDVEGPWAVRLIGPAFTFALAAWLWTRSGGAALGGKARQRRAEQMAQQAQAFLTLVNEQRSFPQVRANRLLDDPSDPLLAASAARQVSLVTTTTRAHAGTRVNLGGLPIFLGRSAPVSTSSIEESNDGELGLTASRLIFVSPGNTFDIRLDRITAVELYFDGFSLSATGRKNQVLFRVDNPVLWSQLIKNVRVLQLQGRALPEGAQLAVL